jgi:diguanylate cyclase (GGDEF)-like protein
MDIITTKQLSDIENIISELTGISFSIFNVDGTLILQSKKEDPLLDQIRSNTYGDEEHKKFLMTNIKKAALKDVISIFQGIAGQYHIFIPLNINGIRLIMVSCSFYNSSSDFEEFLLRDGSSFGFSQMKLQEWLKKIKIKDINTLQRTALHIKSLYEKSLVNSYESNINSLKYQSLKTILDVLFHTSSTGERELCTSITDSIIFLFNVETVSIMKLEKGDFKTIASSGRLKSDVIGLKIGIDHPLVSNSLKNFTFTSTNNAVEITRLGLPNNITSLYIFPLSEDYGLLLLFNAKISKEEATNILELCKMISLVLKNINLYSQSEEFAESISELNKSISEIIHTFNTYMDGIYDKIVDVMTDLFNAEKGSLMIPDENSRLIIKSIKGLNKWLVQDIKVEKGEGIAGKVFKDGNPLFSENIENLNLPYVKPKRHYKTGSFISMPISFNSDVLGVLNLSDKITGEPFSKFDVNFLNCFSLVTSLLIKMAEFCKKAEQLKELSITDSLTGVYNKRYFYERLTEEIHRSERYSFIFSIAIFDIDDFKLFNDTEGHLAGDMVLKDIANIAHKSLRSNDIISRFGGEEFTILMPQTDKEEAFIVAERIRNNIKEFLTRTWEKFPQPSITVSIGVSSFPEDGKDSDSLINNADLALYKAKAEGKNKTILYSKNNNPFSYIKYIKP